MVECGECQFFTTEMENDMALPPCELSGCGAVFGVLDADGGEPELAYWPDSAVDAWRTVIATSS